MDATRFDILVVGSGMSGLTAAAAAAHRGLRVGLVSSGFGQFVFGAGCVERQELGAADRPELLGAAFGFFRGFAAQAGCPFAGGVGEQHVLPTILGTFQSVEMAPSTLMRGEPLPGERVAVVGIEGLSSFDPDFAAEMYAIHGERLGLRAAFAPHWITLSNPPGVPPGILQYANRYDRDLEFRRELLAALKPIAADAGLILIPGIFGQRADAAAYARFEADLGCRVGELSTLPPSAPGLRLYHALVGRLRQSEAEVFAGYPVSRLVVENRHCRGIDVAVPARTLRLSADTVVLASGAFSGALLGNGDFGVDPHLRPIDAAGAAIAENLYVIGALVPAAGRRGGNRRAILTGYRAGMLAAGREVCNAAG